jgi:hypothetical protein
MPEITRIASTRADVDAAQARDEALERGEHWPGHRIQETRHAIDETVAQVDDVEGHEPREYGVPNQGEDEQLKQGAQNEEDEADQRGHQEIRSGNEAPVSAGGSPVARHEA